MDVRSVYKISFGDLIPLSMRNKTTPDIAVHSPAPLMAPTNYIGISYGQPVFDQRNTRQYTRPLLSPRLGPIMATTPVMPQTRC